MPNRQVLQFDLVSFDAAKIETTPQGFIKIPAHFTGVGVYPYRDPSSPLKVKKRFRSATQVFNTDSIKTLNDAPYTKRHPPEMVTPDNVNVYRKGHVSGDVVKVGASLLGGHVIIEDKDAIEDILNGGIRQLSCGYMATIDDTPGVWENPETGEKVEYDDQQVDIVYNHVAGVPQGRQGPDKTLLLDRKEFYFQDGLDFDLPLQSGNPGGDVMLRKITMLDGTVIEVQMDDASFNTIHKAITKAHEDAGDHAKKLRDIKTMCDDMKEKNEKLENEKKEAKDALDAITAQKDTIERELKTIKETHVDGADVKVLNAAVKTRSTMLGVLKQLDPKVKMEDAMELAPKDLMIKVIQVDAALDNVEIDLKDKSDVYIQSAYDAIERREKKTLAQNLTLGLVVLDGRQTETSQMDENNPLNPKNRKAGQNGQFVKKKKQNDEENEEVGGMDRKARDAAGAKYKSYDAPMSKKKMQDRARR